MNLYGLDDQVQELLQLENFQKEFSPKEFIEQLSKNHAGIGTLSEAIDPKPYIRTFEAALSQLQRLREECKKDEQKAAAEVQKTELEHSKNVASLGRSIDGTMADFGVLDGLIGDIGASTSTLSDKLERLSLQHELASSSGFLIECYLSFAERGNCPDLERYWQGPSVLKRKCANVIRQLQTLANRLEGVEKNKKAQQEIDRFAEMLENDLLKLFNDAYSRAELAVMKESADILTDFNGGGSVVQSFVNQHDFFIEVGRMMGQEDDVDDEMWMKLSKVDDDGSDFDNLLQQVMDEILNVTQTEVDIIRKVFRDPVAVLRVFLQRIFAQRIEGKLEEHLNSAEKASLLAYVRVLHISYGKVSSLVKSLKEALNQAEIDHDGELASLLDQNFADVFVIYIENGKYFDRERKSLVECVEMTASRFTEAHQQRKLARDQSLLGRFKSSSASSSGLESKEDKSKDGRIGQLMGFMRTEKSGNGASSAQSADTASSPISSTMVVEFEPIDFEVQYPHVQKMLKMAAESVNRDLELVPQHEISKDAELLLDIIIQQLGHKYIDVALEDAIASSNDAKTEDFGYFKTMNRASAAVQLMATFVKTVLLSMVNGSSTVQKAMITKLNKYIAETERKMNTIIHSTVDLVLSKISTLLSAQKKKDFLPRDDAARPPRTDVSADVTGFLNGFYEKVVQESLDGQNISTFLIETGIGFRDLLMEHIKKNTISAAGAQTLMGDLQLYQETIDNWNISELSEAFGILHAIGNLYVAQPGAITSLIRQNNLSQLKPYVMREYLSKRVDYYSSSINKMVAGSGGSSSAPRNDSGTTSAQRAALRYPMVPPMI